MVWVRESKDTERERERERDASTVLINKTAMEMEQQAQEVVIVGAGIAGLATALALKRVGVRSLVLERSDELRATGAAISLFPNAWRALDALGVSHKLTSIYQAFKTNRVTNLENGATQVVPLNPPTARDGMGVRSVHRKALLEALAEELPEGTIRFSSKLASIKSEALQDSSFITVLHLEDGAVIRSKVVIGCDGVHSVVAQWLGLSAPIDSGWSAIRGLSVYPEGHGFKNEVRQFNGSDDGKRAGFVPLNNREIYWFISLSTPQNKERARDPKLIKREVIDNLARGFPAEYLEVVQSCGDLSTLSWAPLMYRRPWDLILGRAHKGGVVVVGDAMHPMTPDLGQGGCVALEDAVVLGRCIGSGRGAEEGIEVFVRERRWRAAGMIAGAYISGYVQRGVSGIWDWTVRCFRDKFFYRFLVPIILDAAVNYDCGVLPSAS